MIITDGDFDEQGLEERLRSFAADGVQVHVLGVGTPDGDAVPGKDGLWVRGRTGQPVISALNEPQLQSLAKAGGGIYLQADYHESDTGEILAQVKAQPLPESSRDERTRVWNERFYWFTGLALLLLLPLFRRSLPGYKAAKS